MVICLERGADLHMVQQMPLPLIVSCFSKIQIGFAFLVPAHLGSPGKRAVKRVCVCVLLSYDVVAPTLTSCTHRLNHKVRKKQVPAVADRPARLYRAVDGARRSPVINYSVRASEIAGIINLVDRRRAMVYHALSVQH